MDSLALHIESILFSAERPVKPKELKACLDQAFAAKVSIKDIEAALEDLINKYTSGSYAMEIVEINQGFTFLTKETYHKVVGEYLKLNTRKMLSKAALETLSIIAYKQPVTKVEIESIRGVNCDYTIQKLLEKELIAILRRSDGPGRPLIYGTSEKFMNYFGLKDISDLPKLKDFKQPDSEIGDSSSIVEEAIRSSSQN